MVASQSRLLGTAPQPVQQVPQPGGASEADRTGVHLEDRYPRGPGHLGGAVGAGVGDHEQVDGRPEPRHPRRRDAERGEGSGQQLLLVSRRDDHPDDLHRGRHGTSPSRRAG